MFCPSRGRDSRGVASFPEKRGGSAAITRPRYCSALSPDGGVR